MTGAVDPDVVVRRLETTARTHGERVDDLRRRCTDRARPVGAARHLLSDLRHHPNKRAIVRRAAGRAVRAPAHAAKRAQLWLQARWS